MGHREVENYVNNAIGDVTELLHVTDGAGNGKYWFSI